MNIEYNFVIFTKHFLFSNITTKEPTMMKSILGIDLGTSSLGYAVIMSQEGKNSEIHSGVDIFPAAKSNLGSGDKEESNNASRRAQRQMRRQYARKRLRKQHLLALLIRYDMCPLSMEELDAWRKWDKDQKSDLQKFPDSAQFLEWLKLNPYALRVKGLQKDSLTKYEFGRILYSMIQRRGFLSSRKSSDDGTLYNGKDRIKGITETNEKLKEKTLGEYLYGVSAKDGQPFSQTTERIRARYTLRDMYIREFEQIWNAQASHLGLDDVKVVLPKKRIIRGNPHNKENQKRLSKLQEKFGDISITTERSHVDDRDYNYFEYTEERSFKEHLAGKIWQDEEEELRYRSNESVLFWQRPLRSQKGLLDRCTYEGNRFYSKKEQRWVVSGPRVIPVSHPLFEVFRAMQQVMNISLNGLELPRFISAEIFKFLMLGTTKKSVKLSDIKNKFKTLVGRFNYDDDFAFTTCPTIAHIHNLIKEPSSSALQSEDIVFPISFDMELYVKIWHKLYNFDDNTQLADSLKEIDGVVFKDNLEELVGKIKLEEGYGSVSHHALENIVPFMQRGFPLYQSVLLGGISNAVKYANKGRLQLPAEVYDFVLNVLPGEKRHEGDTLQAIIDYMQSKDFPLPTPDARKLRHLLYHPSQPTIEHQLQELLPKVETLRNPLVEQSLWALRRRVNTLLNWYRQEYGSEFRFDEIHIELARDLKTGVKGRQEALRRQRANEEENNEAREIIRGYGLSPTRDNLQKYKLHKELANRNRGVAECPYTGRVISLHDALGSDSGFQIEHIVPRSISNNDSFANKTLCDASVNRMKGNRTPWEFFEATGGDKKIWGVETWEEVCDRARRLLPDTKYNLFISKKTSAELSEGFASSQLVDTAYMSKKAKEYLTSICDKNSVINIPGAVTAELRKLWGLNSILGEAIALSPSHVEHISFPERTDRIPVSILIDKETRCVKQVYPKFATIPTREESDFLASVEKKSNKLIFGKNEFIFPTHYFGHLSEGKHYLLVRSPQIMGFEEQFNHFPISGKDELIINIEIDNKGKLSSVDLNPQLFKNCDIPEEAGRYWVRIPVQNDWKIESSKKELRLKGQSIACNGYIKEGKLRARPFYTQESVDMEDTKNVQVIVTPIMEQAAFVKKKREAPAINDQEFIITGNVAGSLFTSEEDISFVAKAVNHNEGKHYCKLSFSEEDVEWFPYQNTIPECDKKQEEMIEGELEYHKGEILFSPNKNRDDHRHHALDAIVIAMATRSQYQKLSTYNARRDEAARGNAERPRFAMPWEGFREDAKRSVASVLVNHKQKNKVVNKVKKSIRKNGRTYQSIGLAVRGRLSRETNYGERKDPISNQTAMHRRLPIENITKQSQLNKVIDKTIKNLMLARLVELGVDVSKKEFAIPKGAFIDNGEYKVYLPNKNGDPVPVKKVRLRENISLTVQLGDFNQHVEPYKNNHILIYQTIEGKIAEEVVTFWEVADRLRNGENAIQPPVNCAKVLLILKPQELYVIGLSRQKLEEAIETHDNQLISKHLYRMQKFSSNDYTFRLHTASTINNENEMLRVSTNKLVKELKAIKVRIKEDGGIEIHRD